MKLITVYFLLMTTRIVYTDGSCLSNGTRYAKAGVGVYFGDDDPRNLSEKLPEKYKQTNNVAELTAVIRALEILNQDTKTPVKICTDSIYVQKGITQWINNWKKNNWKTTKGSDVENKELWMQLDLLKSDFDSIEFVYVTAHKGVKGNEKADELASSGALL